MKSKKQDRQGVRKASDIEQKYNLALLNNLGGGNQNLDLSNLTQALSQFMVETNAKFSMLFGIGSTYITIEGTNPANVFGGEWELIAEGHLLVGIDSESELPELFQANDSCFIWKRIA